MGEPRVSCAALCSEVSVHPKHLNPDLQQHQAPHPAAFPYHMPRSLGEFAAGLLRIAPGNLWQAATEAAAPALTGARVQWRAGMLCLKKCARTTSGM